MIVRAMRSPYAFWRALLELNVLASLRLRKTISTPVSYFITLGVTLYRYSCEKTSPALQSRAEAFFCRLLLAPLFSFVIFC